MSATGTAGNSNAQEIPENGGDIAQHEADLKAMSEEVCSLQTDCAGSSSIAQSTLTPCHPSHKDEQ